MNPKALAEAEEAAAQLPNIRSFLVVWKGDVVSENTYGGTTAETLHDLRSVTKSIISALVGIAIDRGIIRAVDDCVLDYLPELRSRADDERKAQITIEHLLTMTSGFRSAETWEWYFSDAPHAILDAWDRPMAANPGDTYAYESASMELLSVALARAADQDTKSFAVENLLAPLGITGFQWEQDPAGYHRGAYGLRMRASDLARIGQLYLQEGHWKDRQILSREWIDQSFAQQVRVNDRVSYGHLWRSRQVGSVRTFYGLGFGGQYLIVVPELRLVVVATQDWRVSDEQANRQKFAFTDRIFDPMAKGWNAPRQTNEGGSR